MATGKIRTLYVRPYGSADLSFSNAGILEKRTAQAALGQMVPALDISTIYGAFDPATDSTKITNSLAPYTLFSQRNQPAGVALDQAIRQRLIAINDKYGHITDIVNAFTQAYGAGPVGTPSPRLDRLTQLLATVARRQADVDALVSASPELNRYIDALVTSTVAFDQTKSRDYMASLGSRTPPQTISISGGGQNFTHSIPQSDSYPLRYDAATGWQELDAPDAEHGYLRAYSTTEVGKQATSTRFTDLRHPGVENTLRGVRAQIDLGDEILAQTLIKLRVPKLADTLAKEFEILNLEIKKLQVLFSQTFLYSPIGGQITAIYKDAGEYVSAGEAVLRIEDPSRVYLVGIINCRSLVSVGKIVTVTTTDFFEDRGTTHLSGQVVAVRGHAADRDEWDVLILCQNAPLTITKPDGTNYQTSLPINYQFDKDHTTINVA